MDCYYGIVGGLHIDCSQDGESFKDLEGLEGLQSIGSDTYAPSQADASCTPPELVLFMAWNLRWGPNLEILKNQDCRYFENSSLSIFKMSRKLGLVFKTFGKPTPIPGRSSALGRRRRRRMWVDFPNVVKIDPNGQAPVFKMSTILAFQSFKV